MDMLNGQRVTVATDSITLHGQPFPVILPNQSHKHLGLRMALDGNFLAEKEHVRLDMIQLLAALAEDRVLTQTEKERVITTAVCSVLTYSAGFADWTSTELYHISKMWTRAFKQAWALPSSMDISPFILGQPDGDRGCSLATNFNLWTREVLDVIAQCVSLPETSQIVQHCHRQQCISRGCQTLNQLQLLVRIGGRAASVLQLENHSPSASMNGLGRLLAISPEKVIGPAYVGFSTGVLHLYQVFPPPLHCRLAH